MHFDLEHFDPEQLFTFDREQLIVVFVDDCVEIKLETLCLFVTIHKEYVTTVLMKINQLKCFY